VLRALCDHPQFANDFSHERIAECAPDSLWAELARAVLARCAGVERVDVAALADELSAEARRRLTQLAAEPAGLLEDAERASQAVTEILTGLMRRSARARAHATTRRLANDETDPDSFLREKQAELERRRTSTGVSSP
jgi:hypothetical protein